MQDEEDPTYCVVLDGNRLEEDILCKEQIDRLVEGKEQKCRMVYTLTKAPEHWTGLTGRIGKELLEKEVGHYAPSEPGSDLVLICGPEALEKSTHGFLKELGWDDKDMLFF